jgi:hypothetical protein
MRAPNQQGQTGKKYYRQNSSGQVCHDDLLLMDLKCFLIKGWLPGSIKTVSFKTKPDLGIEIPCGDPKNSH